MQGGAGGRGPRGCPEAGPIPDADTAPEHTSCSLSRSDSGVAGGLDGHITGRCAFVLNRAVDAPDRQVNGR